MLSQRLDRALGDVQFGLAMRSTGEPDVVLKALQDEWYGADDFEKRDGGDPPDAGNHHEPALGREERAFYRALTADQQQAYEALKDVLRGMTPEQWSRFNPFAVDQIVDNWKQAAMMLLAPQAMRSYLVGQLLAAQQMGTAQHLPMSEQDKRAVDFLSHYQFNEIAQSFENLKSDLRRHLIAGVQEGRHPIEVGRVIARELEDYKTQWDVVAITETARAQTQGRLQEYTDEGLTHVEFSTANDPRVCVTCQEFEGRIVRIADLYGKSNYGRKRDDWLPVPPVHPRCRCVLLAALQDDPISGFRGKTVRSVLLKVVDESGHKHDERGRFSATSGTKKPKAPKPSRAAELREGRPAYGHGGYGRVPSGTYASHAGVKGWDPGEIDLGYSVINPGKDEQHAIARGRWDTLLKPLAPGAESVERAEQREWNAEIIERAHGWMGEHLHEIEKFISRKRDKSLDAAAAIRAEHANLYYDYSRSDVAARLRPDDAVEYLRHTAPLAAAMANSAPTDMRDAFNLGDAVNRSMEHQPGFRSYEPIEIANEYLLREYSTSVRAPGAPGSANVETGADAYVEAFEDFVPLSKQDYEDLDGVLRYAYNGWLRNKRGTTLQFRYLTGKGGIGGYASPSSYGGPCVIGIHKALKDRYLVRESDDGGEQERIPLSHGLDSDFTANTIIHEMAHLQSRRSMSAQMDRFNRWMRRVVDAAGAASPNVAPTANPADVDLARWPWTDLLTRHGCNQADYNKISSGTGDFQEDWAIGLGTYILNDSSSGIDLRDEGGVLSLSTREATGSDGPRYETVKALESIIGHEAKTPANIIEHPLVLTRLKEWTKPNGLRWPAWGTLAGHLRNVELPTP
jgi:SPP1 gp7 family putative phage head morphogenesis protein